MEPEPPWPSPTGIALQHRISATAVKRCNGRRTHVDGQDRIFSPRNPTCKNPPCNSFFDAGLVTLPGDPSTHPSHRDKGLRTPTSDLWEPGDAGYFSIPRFPARLFHRGRKCGRNVFGRGQEPDGGFGHVRRTTCCIRPLSRPFLAEGGRRRLGDWMTAGDILSTLQGSGGRFDRCGIKTDAPSSSTL